MTPGEVVVNVTYLGALIAGFLSFLSPCVLPLVPPYLCFLGGTTFDQLTGEDETPSHVYTTVVLSSVAFVLGFTTVFVILGATATAAGQLIAENLPLLSKIAGVVIIIAGLHFLGLIHLPVLHREARYHADARPAGLLGAYLIGVRVLGVDAGAFWGQMQAGVKVWPDVSNGIIKSLVFGTAVSLIAVLDGYDAKPTAEGVSSATTRTVVVSSLAILALDFVLTVFMFRGVGS